MLALCLVLSTPLLAGALSDPYRGTKSRTELQWSGTQAEQRARALKAHVAEVCQAHPLTRHKHRLPHSIALETEQNVAYCITHKAASTTILSHLYQLHDPNFNLDVIDRDLWNSSNMELLEGTNVGVRNATSLNEYRRQHGTFVFTFVRHPFVRLVSAFVDKVVFGIDPGWGRLAEEVQGSFPRFVDYILEDLRRNVRVDPHWCPWSDRCDPCRINFDFIGTVENFTDDMRYMVGAAGLGGHHLGVRHVRRESTQEFEESDHGNRTAAYFAALTPRQKQELYDVYERDFELLGYSPHPYL